MNMMKSICAIVSLLLNGAAFCATFYVGISQVVGYIRSEVKPGLNEIEITMDSMGLFPTLEKIVRFEPPENVVGDDLIFDLDGKRLRYFIESYDGTNAVMTTKMLWVPKEIGLDWIPLRDRIWLNHKTDKHLALSNSGQINDAEQKRLDPRPGVEKREIKITLVDDAEKQRKILFGK